MEICQSEAFTRGLVVALAGRRLLRGGMEASKQPHRVYSQHEARFNPISSEERLEETQLGSSLVLCMDTFCIQVADTAEEQEVVMSRRQRRNREVHACSRILSSDHEQPAIR
ncbi:unnamed protein product [Pleuronectes platessa]|uniref:Uncharacterized protein n=1 Tax=Pleuronectes platessa TaxID=8262 RepID=A0A9N7TKU0_PLEPL|nr:unnamed protein product [Pleuronectes platessa]